MAKDYYYLEDYEIGEKFISPGRTVTETDIVLFAGLTGDWTSLHTDVEYASKTKFGERIAHGMLTLSIGMALPFRLGLYSSVLPKHFIAFYGMDSVRFTAPVKIGDTIRCEFEVVDIVDKSEGKGILTVKSLIKNQCDNVVVSFIMKLFCGKRGCENTIA
ncbi:MAG: MaoC family dehydratase N-terminal domain-containing protein [Deltaproteobacteria bacterium]|nr:MaoC family dehydratase N-terminal domain-containing protein [Deltaproteobacteria bacterium]